MCESLPFGNNGSLFVVAYHHRLRQEKQLLPGRRRRSYTRNQNIAQRTHKSPADSGIQARKQPFPLATTAVPPRPLRVLARCRLTIKCQEGTNSTCVCQRS
ncbi:unnamed protein product [Ectocarpus fasciculatus]